MMTTALVFEKYDLGFQNLKRITSRDHAAFGDALSSTGWYLKFGIQQMFTHYKDTKSN